MENSFAYKAPRVPRATAEPKITSILIHTYIDDALQNFASQLTKYLRDALNEVVSKVLADVDALKAKVEQLEERVLSMGENPQIHRENAGNPDFKSLELKVEVQEKYIEQLRNFKTSPIGRLSDRFQRAEDQQRSKNLIVHGIQVNAADKDPFLSAADFFKNKLGLVVPLENAYRMKKGKKAVPPLFVRLQNAGDKFKIFKNCVKLKDVNLTLPVADRFSIQEDVSYETRQQRMTWWPTFQHLKNENKKVHFRGPFLFCDGKKYDGEMIQILHNTETGAPE